MMLEYGCLQCGNTRWINSNPKANTVNVPLCCNKHMLATGRAIREVERLVGERAGIRGQK